MTDLGKVDRLALGEENRRRLRVAAAFNKTLAAMREKTLAECEAIARDHNGRGLSWWIADSIAALKDKP